MLRSSAGGSYPIETLSVECCGDAACRNKARRPLHWHPEPPMTRGLSSISTDIVQITGRCQTAGAQDLPVMRETLVSARAGSSRGPICPRNVQPRLVSPRPDASGRRRRSKGSQTRCSRAARCRRDPPPRAARANCPRHRAAIARPGHALNARRRSRARSGWSCRTTRCPRCPTHCRARGFRSARWGRVASAGRAHQGVQVTPKSGTRKLMLARTRVAIAGLGHDLARAATLSEPVAYQSV